MGGYKNSSQYMRVNAFYGDRINSERILFHESKGSIGNRGSSREFNSMRRLSRLIILLTSGFVLITIANLILFEATSKKLRDIQKTSSISLPAQSAGSYQEVPREIALILADKANAQVKNSEISHRTFLTSDERKNERNVEPRQSLGIPGDVHHFPVQELQREDKSPSVLVNHSQAFRFRATGANWVQPPPKALNTDNAENSQAENSLRDSSAIVQHQPHSPVLRNHPNFFNDPARMHKAMSSWSNPAPAAEVPRVLYPSPHSLGRPVEPPSGPSNEGKENYKWNYNIPGEEIILQQFTYENALTAGKEYTEKDRQRSRSSSLNHIPGTSLAARQDFSKIKQIWIWGERCSCTTAITDLILKNFNLKCELLTSATDPPPVSRFSRYRQDTAKKCVIGGLPWKHDFMRRANLDHKDETLHILVTRHPYEWLESFRRNSFYASIHKNLDMEKFLTLEWLSFDVSADEQNRLDSYLRRNPPSLVSGNQPPSVQIPYGPSIVQSSGSMSYGQEAVPSPLRNPACGAAQMPFCFISRWSRDQPCCYNDKLFKCTPYPGPNALDPSSCIRAALSMRACTAGMRLCEVKEEASSAGQPSDASDFKALSPRDSKMAIPKRSLLSFTGASSSVSNSISKIWPARKAERPSALGMSSIWNSNGHINHVRDNSRPLSQRAPPPPSWMSLNSNRAGNAVFRSSFDTSSERRFRGVDRFPSRYHSSLGVVKEKLSDRDPDTGQRFPTVTAMREGKLRDWVAMSDKLAFTDHVACRDFMLDPNAVLDRLQRRFQLQKLVNYGWDLGVCMWHFGICVSRSNHMNDGEQVAKRNRYLQGQHMYAFSEKTLAIANAWLDPELEAKFGYKLFDTVEEASKPYTESSKCHVHGSCDNPN